MKGLNNKWLIGGGIVALFLIVVLIFSGGDDKKITYQPAQVERGDLSKVILSTGVVQPKNRLDIKPPIAGRTELILVDEGDVVKKGQVLLWMSSTERAALLDAARARGPGELKRWEGFYKATPVMAPIDGTIILRNIEPGQTFTTADAVLTMSDRLTIQGQVDETDIAQVALKQPAKIILDAYPDSEIPGEVEKIAYDAKTVNNVTTYIVDVLPDEIPEFMRSGMTANLSFLSENKTGVLLVPTAAIKVRADHSFVLTPATVIGVQPKEVEIKTGISDGKRTEVVSGLAEGDKILVPQLKGKGTSSGGGSSPFSPYGKPKGK